MIIFSVSSIGASNALEFVITRQVNKSFYLSLKCFG